jgi:FtsP/CotA-like multicopper oxidase with cupredoxin domain
VARRTFLGLGAAGAVGGAALFRIPGVRRNAGNADAGDVDGAAGYCRMPISAAGAGGHAGMGTVGKVDHARNGFDPHEILTDFDWGTVSRDRSGRVVREYQLIAIPKEIEVAPGVFFPAWTYNGRVPGPSIRAVEGDRLRVTLVNASTHPHTVHFHGFHPAAIDGVPGAGEAMPGDTFVYDFIAEPFGTHLYHCHSMPLREHIARGLYGAFIVDPLRGRPAAHEMVMVLNAFDTNFDGENEIYAANTVAFAYMDPPITIHAGDLQRLHVVNVTEFDPINSIHLHANFFHLYRTGTSLTPHELTDTVTMGQAERHMLEFTYREPGDFMLHAHQSEFVQLGWMSRFAVI